MERKYGGEEGREKKNCRGTRNDESCQGGKWNAAALYSIVSSKFVSDKKKSHFTELVEKAKTKREIKKGKRRKKKERKKSEKVASNSN